MKIADLVLKNLHALSSRLTKHGIHINMVGLSLIVDYIVKRGTLVVVLTGNL